MRARAPAVVRREADRPPVFFCAEYDDFLEFSLVNDPSARFRVPIRAEIAKLAAEVTPRLEFGVVPVNEPTPMTVTLSNTGQVPMSFEWRVPSLFTFEPRTGSLAVGARVTVQVTLLPTAAAILDATAVAVVEGGELLLAVRLAARAKYQFVSLSSHVADLGAILRGGGAASDAAAMSKTVTVTNQSTVRATLQVAPAGGSSPAYFTVSPAGGVVIPAGGSVDLTATLSADAPAGARPCERFAVSVPGGNSAILTCRAAIGGPVVTAARKDRVGAPPAKRPLTVQFGDLEVRSVWGLRCAQALLQAPARLPVCACVCASFARSRRSARGRRTL